VLAFVEQQPFTESMLTNIWLLMASEPAGEMIEASYQCELLAHLHGRLSVDVEQGRPLRDFANLPFKEAIEFFRSKRIMPAEEFKRLDDSTRRNAFTVAGLNRRFTLERSHELLADALETGADQRTTVNRLRDSFDAWGVTEAQPHHLETVFRTNVIGAYGDGRYRQAQKVKRTRPFWRYTTVGDARVRPAHAAQNGKVYPADHPFWDIWTPPCGYSCRCGLETLARHEVEDEGLEVLDKMPAEKPDPGWAGSPRLADRADEQMAKLRREARKREVLRAPELATRGTRPFAATGDLGVRDSRRAARVVDRLAGVDAAGAERLAAEGETAVQAKVTALLHLVQGPGKRRGPNHGVGQVFPGGVHDVNDSSGHDWLPSALGQEKGRKNRQAQPEAPCRTF
jgi:SPP1 gp7 family putative phage head morphogenesis protein